MAEDQIIARHPHGALYRAEIPCYLIETLTYDTPPEGDANLVSITYSCLTNHSPRIIQRQKSYSSYNEETGITAALTETTKAKGEWDNRYELTYVPWHQDGELLESDPPPVS